MYSNKPIQQGGEGKKIKNIAEISHIFYNKNAPNICANKVIMIIVDSKQKTWFYFDELNR